MADVRSLWRRWGWGSDGSDDGSDGRWQPAWDVNGRRCWLQVLMDVVRCISMDAQISRVRVLMWMMVTELMRMVMMAEQARNFS